MKIVFNMFDGNSIGFEINLNRLLSIEIQRKEMNHPNQISLFQ